MTVTAATGEHWSSRAAFLLAAIGSAVGLGNLWRFPAEAGSNGGGAFILVYVLCVVLIGLPILLSEVVIGREGSQSAVGSARGLALQSGRTPAWSALAWVGMIGAYMILTFYSVIAGWVIYYIWLFGGDFLSALAAGNPGAGAFANMDIDTIRGQLDSLFASPLRLIALHGLFMAITAYFVARGIKSGIEIAANFLMPLFFLLFIGITVYAIVTGDFEQAAKFLFSFDLEKALSGPVMLSALGQAFFSLSLGSALMITYGAYASRDVNLGNTSLIIAAADTSVALIAGLAIFPIVFAVGMAPDAGPTLMFQTLPAAFHSMPGGSLIGLLFFILVLCAALTSSVALLEAPTAFAIDRMRIARVPAAIVLAVTAFAVGCLSALSFNTMATVYPLDFIPIFAGQNIFGVMDGVSGKILLPLSGLLTALFIGWAADRRIVDADTGLSPTMFVLWRFLVAWLCPLALAAILIFGLRG